MQLSDADHARVTTAVAQAEQGTDGEIVTIVADRSDAYHDVVLHWALLAMLLALAIVAARPGLLLWARSLLDGGWGHEHGLRDLLTFLLAIVVATFLVARLLFGSDPIRLSLVPGSTKARRVRRRAVLLFKAGTEKRTVGRVGVLLYLSLAEHRAEIVADEAIHTKVPPERWGEAMALLLDAVKDGRPGDGMIAAVGEIGAELSRVFPKSLADTNELPDRLIEL